VILTVARILAHKGHGLVLEALASMPASVRESFVYLVAGQGRDLEMLQKEARFYAEDVRRLEDLLKRDLSLWTPGPATPPATLQQNAG
jgi:glycosyltransferase involved in cell wall biosynthesis